ncbi:unnamed protein product [Calypogeia fissa]
MRSTFGDGDPVAHVLAIPFTVPGHLNPMLRFATQLARSGITVSFVCMEDKIPRLTSTETESPHFHFVPVQQPATERPGWLNFLKDSLEPLMEKLINDKNAGIAGPTCIISDLFLSWTRDVAEKLKIPWYMLMTSGVLLARFWQGSLEYFDDGRFQVSEADGKLVEFDGSVCIYGVPPLRFYELDNIIRDEVPFLRQVAESLTRSAGVVVNSFLELEEKVVEAFRNPDGDGEKHTKVPKIYPLGPLFSTTNLTTTGNVYGLEDSSSQCIRWLDSQPSSSVLYVAFGSATRLRPEQIQEVAYGLEASHQRFLWACPLKKIRGEEESPTSITEVLPPGFEERVGDRGCIVTGWAPQLEILAHASTAGFFTHSGWNSSLESVIFGIPMISWPQAAEQHMNCKYMVDMLKIAEQLQTGKENNVTRNEVERAVRLLMVDSEGKAIKKRAEELKKIAAAATAEGGSRSRIFNEFLDDIRPH